MEISAPIHASSWLVVHCSVARNAVSSLPCPSAICLLSMERCEETMFYQLLADQILPATELSVAFATIKSKRLGKFEPAWFTQFHISKVRSTVLPSKKASHWAIHGPATVKYLGPGRFQLADWDPFVDPSRSHAPKKTASTADAAPSLLLT